MNPLALDRQLCFALYSASRAMTATYRELLDDLGITYPQYLVMLVLWEHSSGVGDTDVMSATDDSGVSVKELGSRLQLDSGTLSPLLSRLENLGFVTRRRSAADSRSVSVQLTAKGISARADAECIPPELVERTKIDPDESAKLLDTLQFLTSTLRKSPRHITDPPQNAPPMKGMIMKALYTAEALTTGEGRDGHGRTSDGKVDVTLATPTEMGGSGEGTNPEQLFAVGYAACFHSALRLVARQAKANIDDSAVGAQVSIGSNDAGGFQLAVALEVTLPHVEQAEAKALADKAHEVCPYSNATRGNIEVTISVTDD